MVVRFLHLDHPRHKPVNLHVLATDGCFYHGAAFRVCSPPDTGALEKLFRDEVFKMLKTAGKITDVAIENMMNGRHSGSNVYGGNAIWPPNQEGLESLARTCPAFRRDYPIHKDGHHLTFKIGAQ